MITKTKIVAHVRCANLAVDIDWRHPNNGENPRGYYAKYNIGCGTWMLHFLGGRLTDVLEYIESLHEGSLVEPYSQKLKRKLGVTHGLYTVEKRR